MTVASPCTQHLMDSAHPQTVLSKLNEQRSLGLFCDVTIVVEDVKFRAHRNVLAASSGFFKNALTANETWNSSQVLELMDLRSTVFANILNFIYCSKVTSCGAEDTDSLVAAGKRLGIPFLEKFADTQHFSLISNSHKDSVKQTDPIRITVPKIMQKELPRPADLDRGPRITNAFSMTEVCPGNNPFPPLGQPIGEKESPDVRQLPTSCPAKSCFSVSNETTHALSEHSYAVSHTADAADNSQRDKKLCRPSISQSKQLMYRNAGPLKKRHRLRGTLCKSILPTPVDLHTDNVSTTAQTLDSAGTVAPAAVLTPPPLISVANTDKTNDSGLPMDVDDASFELGPPTLSPQTEESISVYSCNHCPELFTNKAILAVHKTIHKKRFVGHLFCKFCHRKFIHPKRLRNHEQVCPKEVQGLPNHVTQTMSHEVESNLENMSKDNDAMQQLPSPGLSIHDAPEVDRIAQSEPIKRIKTIIPSANQRRYNCSVCKRVYVTLSSLKRHENVHSWQRAYPCHYCNKVFALAEYRTKHEIWHTGERRYQCIFCLETFMTYYILRNHQKSFHGIDPSLAVKKKSANGGLKASVYPIKLYRLLPMKFRKTRYKTYSNTYSAASETEQGAQDTDPLPSSYEESPHNPSLPLTFMVTTKTMAPIVPHITVDKPCDQGIGQSSKSEMLNKNTENEINTPFLSFASTLPLQSDKESYADPSSLLLSSLHNVKKLSELSASAKRVEDMTKELLQSGPDDLLHNRNEMTETYIAKPACLGPSAGSDPLPLCQITVKIGNEAIIRRRIKGSKLFPKKKRKINEFGQVGRFGLDTSEARHRQDGPAIEEDANDMLWRPYYTYKTKKKKKKIKDDKQPCSALTHLEMVGKRGSEEHSSNGNAELKQSLLRYNCDICDSSFITENGLRAHVIGSHPCFCRTCGKQGPPGEVPAGGDYVCKKCMENGSCFDSQPRSPGTEKKYRCSFCPQRFLYLATKKSHEKKHQNSSKDKEFQFEGFSPKCSANQGEENKQDVIKSEDSDHHDKINIKSEEENYLIGKPKSEDTDSMSAYEEDPYSNVKSPLSLRVDPQFSQPAPKVKLKNSKSRFDDPYSKDSMHLTPKKKYTNKDDREELWPDFKNGFKKTKKLSWRGEAKDTADPKHRPEKWVCKEEPLSNDI